MWTAAIAILAAAQLALAAPVNDGRIKLVEHEPSYVSSPRGRGTMDLMFTCVITLSLCVWTAVHPNIIARSTYMDRLRYKALYVVLGLFSPEIVLSEAFNEWRTARNLRAWLHREAAQKILDNAVEKANQLLERDSVLVHGRRPSPSDSDARVKALSALRDAITKVEAGESITPDKRWLRWLRWLPRLGWLRWPSWLHRPGWLRWPSWLHRPHWLRWLHWPHWPRLLATRTRRVAIEIRNKVEDAMGDIEELKDADYPEESANMSRSKDEQANSGRSPAPFTRETKQEGNDRVKRILKQLTALDKATKNYLSAQRISEAREASWLHGLGRWFIEFLPFTSPSEEETPTFTMEIAFFIVMGGLTFSPIDHLKYRAYERTLSAYGLMALVRNGVVDPIRLLELKVDIQDKGKSDILAKVLVCAQASWMMTNCLLRKAAGLPITVIELNVIVHVMSMIAIYACWWKKPHDAGMPIPLNIFLEDQAVCSLLFIQQSKDPKEVLGKPETSTSSAHTTSAEGVSGDDAPKVESSIAPEVERGKHRRVKKGKKEIERTSDEYGHIRADARRALGLKCCAKIWEIKDITTLPGRFKFRSLVVVLIPLCLIYGGIHASLWNAYFPTTIERWLWRASACIVAVPGLGSAAIWGVKIIITRDLGKYKGAQIGNPLDILYSMITVIAVVVFLPALSIPIAAAPLGAMGGVIYGGILGHRKIMKLALRLRILCYVEFLGAIALGVFISGAGFVLAVGGCVQMWEKIFERFNKQFREVTKVPLAVALLVAALFVIVYCGARAFILVETFICLRSLPVGAYKTVRWDEFWPHL
ncbi:uncharacterized protein LAJ45_07760 [Morchella importuna]|uniref:uncharacterized protein n=1 Tax=Morchella importuna TaxID=1174673 RepID=UPI001E8DB97E|nr:uncharacterized protein LAJ45_07760 [Morchella importuna]KAH8148307.1 hypothetical protein LAJ45_07760 [Morchella importuna]